jgi:hypothetical protein
MRRNSRLGIAIGVAIVCICFACGRIDEDELLCEEAVARLEDCCPKFDVRPYECRYNGGCAYQEPDLSAAASDCIRARSCEELVSTGTCERLTQIVLTPSTGFGTPPARALAEQEACR